MEIYLLTKRNCKILLNTSKPFEYNFSLQKNCGSLTKGKYISGWCLRTSYNAVVPHLAEPRIKKFGNNIFSLTVHLLPQLLFI